MTKSSYECDGCRAVLDAKRDLDQEQGTVSSRWRCRYCGTEVPAIVAEKIKHQTQH